MDNIDYIQLHTVAYDEGDDNDISIDTISELFENSSLLQWAFIISLTTVITSTSIRTNNLAFAIPILASESRRD